MSFHEEKHEDGSFSLTCDGHFFFARRRSLENKFVIIEVSKDGYVPLGTTHDEIEIKNIITNYMKESNK